MFMIGGLQDVHAPGHFIVRHIKGDGLYIVFVVDGVLCQDGHEERLTYELEQNVHLIELDSDVEMAVIMHDAVESVASLQPFGG